MEPGDGDGDTPACVAARRCVCSQCDRWKRRPASGGPCDLGAAPRGDGGGGGGGAQQKGSRAFHLTDRWADTHSLLPRASLRYGVESAL